MRLMGYVRVSTEEQAKEGVSLAGQESRIPSWAAAMGHEVVGVLGDKGVSGATSPGQREGFRADMALLDEGQTTCCYARSEKHWVTDPQGIAWVHFHTLGNIPVFSQGPKTDPGPACCSPTPRGKPVGIPVKSQSSCC